MGEPTFSLTLPLALPADPTGTPPDGARYFNTTRGVDRAWTAAQGWHDVPAPAVTNLAAVPLHTYGDSNHAVSLNQNSATVGQQLGRLLSMPLFEGAVAGTQALDVPVSLLFGGSLDRGAGAPAILKDSYPLPVPFRGVVLIGTGTNDVAQHGNDPLMVTRVRNALRAAVRIAQAAAKKAPTDASLTYSAGWSTGPNIFAVGGTAKAATATGSYVDVTFTGDTVTLLTAGLQGAGGPQVSATESGSAWGSWDLSSLGPSDAASTKLGYVPLVPLTVSGLGGGSHTLRFTKTTAASEFDVLGVLVQSTAPAQVLLLDQPGPADAWSSYDVAKTGVSYYGNGSDAGLASVNGVLADLATEFGPTVSVVPVTVGFDKPTMIAQPYGAHFNDRGVAHAANKVIQTLLPVGWRDGVQVLGAEGAPTPGLTGFKTVYRAASTTASDGELVLADAGTAALTITLPKPWPDRRVIVKKLDATTNVVTVATPAGLIDGAATVALSVRYTAVECVSDGTNWHVVRRYAPNLTELAKGPLNTALYPAPDTAPSAYPVGVVTYAQVIEEWPLAGHLLTMRSDGVYGTMQLLLGEGFAKIRYASGASSWGTWKQLASSDDLTPLLSKSAVDAKGDLLVATANDTVARLPVGADGLVLTADSAASEGVSWQPSGGGGTIPSQSAPPASPTPGSLYRDSDDGLYYAWTGTTWLALARQPDIQVFDASGTWTKPPWATTVYVDLVSAGGGGGSGRKGAAGSIRCAGGGGAGGGRAIGTYRASDLPATVGVTIPAGGNGGAAQSANDTNGNGGFIGGSTNFGSYLTANGGGAGSGGTSSGGTGGSQPVAMFTGATGAGASGSGGSGITVGTSAIAAASGGGAGGGITSGNVAGTGGAGGTVHMFGTAGGAGGAVGAAGSVGNVSATKGPGSGGGGGGASTAGNAGAGGNGGAWGGGGGSGGAAVNSVGNSGAGGNGGSGGCLVISW